MNLPKRRLLLAALTLLSPLAACESEGTGTDDLAVDEDDTASSEGTDETGEPEVPSSIPALGIHISEVEVNQGTAVLVGKDGQWVGAADRLGAIVSKRDTLVRIHHRVDPGWVPRDIQAQLTLEFADGTQKIIADTRMVSEDSSRNTLDGTFYFGLAASDNEIEPGMNYQVTLHEVDEAGEQLARDAGLSEGTWQTPPEPDLVGVQAEPLELKVVFVPFHHKYGSIDRVTDTSDETMKILTDHIYEHNATHKLIWSVHEPLLWDHEMTSLGAVLGPLSALRETNQAFPNEYYAGLFPVPNGGVAGVAGVAQVPGPGKGEGASRVSVTALGNSVGGAAGTLVHELGHTEGMAHVFCPFAESASPDPAYPYTNGVIGQWGFGILSFRLYPPDSHYDYMSYCGPSWVSTWSWNKSFERILTLTSWEYEAGGLDTSGMGTILIGAMLPDGSEDWWTARGTLPEQASVFGDDQLQHLELYAGDQLVALTPSVVRYTNELSTAWVISELPAGLERLAGIDTIVRIDDTLQAHPVPVSAVELSARQDIAVD
jgi:hypothetical protein